MIVRDAVAEFLSFCQETKRPKTVDFYKGRLKRLVELLGDRELSSLTPLEIHKYLIEAGKRKDGTPLSDSTKCH